MKKMILVLFVLCFFLAGCGGGDNEQKTNTKINSVYELIMKEDVALEDYQKHDFLAFDNGKYGVINYKGEVVIDFIYDKIYITHSGAYLGKRGDTYDLIRDYEIDQDFSLTLEVLENQFDSYVFEENLGLWRVRSGDKRTYVDIRGNLLNVWLDEISPVYVYAEGAVVANNLFASYQQRDNQYYCALFDLDWNQVTPYSILAEEYYGQKHCNVYGNIFTLENNAMWSTNYISKAEIDLLVIDTTVYDAKGNILLNSADMVYFSGDNKFPIYYDIDGETYRMSSMGDIEKAPMQIDDLLIYKKEGFWGVENTKGKVIIDFVYDQIYPFYGFYNGTENNFEVIKDGEKSLFNDKGEKLFDYDYDVLSYSNNEDIFIGYREDWKSQIINRQGEVIIDGWFNSIYAGQFIYAVLNAGYEIYNLEGELIYESLYDVDWALLNNLPYFKGIEDGETYVLNDKLEKLGVYQFMFIDYVIYEKDGKHYADNGKIQREVDFIDRNDQYPLVTSIQGIDGAFIKIDGKYQFLDENLESLVEIECDAIYEVGSLSFSKNQYVQYFAVGNEGLYALMLESGELLTEFEYNEFAWMGEYGFIAVRKGDYWGILNYRGEEITEFVYDFSELHREYFYGNFIGEWYRFYGKNEYQR